MRISDWSSDVCSSDLVRMHDARGNQAQNGFLAIDPQRMAGIVATLKTDHSVRRFSQPVDDLSLAFITPLGADYNNILAHVPYQKRFGPKDAKAKVDFTYTIKQPAPPD